MIICSIQVKRRVKRWVVSAASFGITLNALSANFPTNEGAATASDMRELRLLLEIEKGKDGCIITAKTDFHYNLGPMPADSHNIEGVCRQKN